MRRSGLLLALLALVLAHGTALAQPAPDDPWTGMRRDRENAPPARPARAAPATTTPSSPTPSPATPSSTNASAAAQPARAAAVAVPIPRPRPPEAPAAQDAPVTARAGALPPPSNLVATAPSEPPATDAQADAPPATETAPSEAASAPSPEGARPSQPEAAMVQAPETAQVPEGGAQDAQVVAAQVVAAQASQAPAEAAQVAEAQPTAASAAVPAAQSSALSLLSLADGVLTPASLTALAAFSPIGPAAAAPVNIPLPPPAAAQPAALPPATAPGVTAPLTAPLPTPKPEAMKPASPPSAAPAPPAPSVAAPPPAVAPQTPSVAPANPVAKEQAAPPAPASPAPAAVAPAPVAPSLVTPAPVAPSQVGPAPAAAAAPDLPVLPPMTPRPVPPAPVAQPQAPPAAPAPPVAAVPSVAAPVVVAPPVPAAPPSAAPPSAAPAVATPAVPALPPPARAQAPVGQVEPSPGSRRAPLWPQDLVRALRRVQDSMAQGSTDAVNAQREIIARIEREFAAAEPSVWEDPHNARAAVTYFLSGGNPAVLRRIMDQQPGPAIDGRLLRGTLAYLEGREDEALRQLKDIDARALPASLGGQVALAQAALFLRTDPKKSAELLGVARVLAPGTLVEEAALRRAILVAAQMNDAAQFEYLSRQYLFRFRNSVYAGNFRQRFAAALSRMGFGNAPDQLQRLEQMLEMLEPESRRDMELTLARAAVVQGRTTTANFAAERALSTTPDGSADAERARLYRGASMAPSAQTYGEALTELKAIDRDRLAPADLALLDAASATAENVKRATDNAAPTIPLPPGPVASAPSASPQMPGQVQAQPPAGQRPQDISGPLTKEEMLPVLDRARAALANADASLKGGPR